MNKLQLFQIFCAPTHQCAVIVEFAQMNYLYPNPLNFVTEDQRVSNVL
jgi:hypothetical protein